MDVHELGSGRRPLGHIFQWQGVEDENDTSSKPVSCRNSVQGKALIADNKGILEIISHLSVENVANFSHTKFK